MKKNGKPVPNDVKQDNEVVLGNAEGGENSEHAKVEAWNAQFNHYRSEHNRRML
jgi:hypothetical protein